MERQRHCSATMSASVVEIAKEADGTEAARRSGAGLVVVVGIVVVVIQKAYSRTVQIVCWFLVLCAMFKFESCVCDRVLHMQD